MAKSVLFLGLYSKITHLMMIFHSFVHNFGPHIRQCAYMCGVYFRHSVFRDDIERKTERMHHFARPGEKGNLIPDF